MMRITLISVAAAAAALALPAGAAAGVQKAVPIAETGPAASGPAFQGAVAKRSRFSGVTPPAQNPFMAPDPTNNVHNDSWMTDDYSQFGGPLGTSPKTFSTSFGRTCITLTFDRKGRLIGSCISIAEGPALYLFDPETLDILATLQLPFKPPAAGVNPATNTTGGAYFYLDRKGRVVSATTDRRIFVVAETTSGGKPAFKKVAEYAPGTCLGTDERMPSALPDYDGRIWFVGREGSVGILDTKTGKCGATKVEAIENSFAIGKDGAYVVSDKALYKLRADRGSKPRVVWRQAYKNTGKQKVGQFSPGSGTTPTLIAPGGGKVPAYVAITDNADPLNMVVVRAADKLGRGQKRLVCEVPIFSKGASSDENSLIAAGRSIFAENNSGYDLTKWSSDPTAVTEPGMARVDVAADGSGCRKVWTSTAVRPATVVSKANSYNGLIYTYENATDDGGADPWNWVAVDMRTGTVRWRQRSGVGNNYNNHYAGIALGRSGGKPTLYLGGVAGIMAVRDG
jgi:hypothetical protein